MAPSDSYAQLVEALGIDFGTTYTVAVLRWRGGRTRPLLFDNSPQLPSAVYCAPDGQLETGAAALRLGRRYPDRLEPNPKQRIDDGTLWLANREVAVVDAIAAVLARVRAEAVRVAGLPQTIVLTVPASWGPSRRQLLLEAARRAALPSARVVAEPVAAAAYYLHTLEHELPIGDAVAVFDAGAGTFDASVVRRSPNGFDTLALEGREDLGGLDLDEDLLDHLNRIYGEHDGWTSLVNPSTVAEQRDSRALADEIRLAREQLSRTAQVELYIPGLDIGSLLTRSEVEQAIAPRIRRAVDITASVIREARPGMNQLAGVFLVGGTSRTPLAAATLHRQLGLAPTVLEQPELVVAEGSLMAAAYAAPVTPLGSSPLRPFGSPIDYGLPTPANPLPVTPPPEHSLPPRGTVHDRKSRRGIVIAAAIASVAALAAATSVVTLWPEAKPSAIHAQVGPETPGPIAHEDPTMESPSHYLHAQSIYEANFPEVVGHIASAHDGEILSLASFSHEEHGDVLLTGGDDGTVRSWNLLTGGQFGQFQRLNQEVVHLGPYVDGDEAVQVWSQHSQHGWHWEWDSHQLADQPVTSDPEGSQMVWAGEIDQAPHTMSIDVESKPPTVDVGGLGRDDPDLSWTLSGLTHAADPVSIDGQLRFVGIAHGEIVQVDLKSGTPIDSMELHADPHDLTHFHTGTYDGVPAAVAVADGHLHFYDLAASQVLADPISLGDKEISHLHIGDTWGYPFIGTVDSDHTVTLYSTVSGGQISDHYQVETMSTAHFTYIDLHPVVVVAHHGGGLSVVALSLS
ncbi:Hsp70 family protein [Natronoglycomyces albus]|uniref:Hsp70 family protein n=1 Tax=Natronoglycomyces albus TaxID=2811108 RepID=A0A895XUJ5_9ACTN|nr:Hsp70 family protein [Natronoglycomyces albus]QSB06196.1 Hsp70 family protein [Natronoglycomyces albus]